MMKTQFLRFGLLILVAVLPFSGVGQTLARLKGTSPLFIRNTGFYMGGVNRADTLYFTDGTSEGTVAVYTSTVFDGTYFFEDERRNQLMPRIDKSYFFYSLKNSGTLSKSDGTLAGTSDIKTKFLVGDQAVVIQSLLYFPASENPNGSNNLRYSLWKSDGTTAGTIPVKSTALGIDVLFALGNKLLLNASESSGSTEKIGRELWISDGTDQGTKLLKDIWPGINTTGSAPTSNQSDPRFFYQVNNKAVFVANDDGGGYRMWVTDGTETGTTLLQSDRIGLSINYIGLNAKDGILYFIRRLTDKSWELWGTDGSPAGTRKVDLATIVDASTLNYLLNDDGFFYGNGTEIRQINRMQTSLVVDTKPLIKNSFALTAPSLLGYQKGIFYLTYLSDNRVARTDGTTAGSYILTNATSGLDKCDLGTYDKFHDSFFVINDKVYLREYGTGILFTRVDQKNGKEVRVEIYNKNDQLTFFPGSKTLLNGRYVGSGWAGNNTSSYFPLAFDPGPSPAQTCFLKAIVSGTPSYLTGNLPLPCTVNGTTSLSSTVTDGIAPLSYQWLRNGVAITGAASATYAAGSVGDYTVLVTDSKSCSAVAVARTVSGPQAMSVTVGGADVVCTQILSSINYVPTLRAGITGGTAPFTYQWALAGKPLSSTTAEQRISSGGVYSLTVTDACSSSILSKTLTETVLAVTVSGGTVACTGQPVALTASTTGGRLPYTYTWTLNNGPVIATTSILSATATNGSYRVTATSADGCSWFTDVLKGGTPLPITVSITGSTTMCTGQPATLTASLTGGTAPYTYQWKQNGNVVGTNAASLSISTGGTYSLSVTDACSSTTASFSVSAVACVVPTILLPAGGATATTPITMTASTGLTGGADAGATFQWLLNGNPIAGAVSSTYSTSTSGSYAVAVTLSGRVTTSPAVTLTINVVLATEPLGLTENRVTVYPNPTTGECWVLVDMAMRQTATLSLTDALGKTVRQWKAPVGPKMQPLRITLPDTDGLYFLRTETEQGVVVKKIVRSR